MKIRLLILLFCLPIVAFTQEPEWIIRPIVPKVYDFDYDTKRPKGAFLIKHKGKVGVMNLAGRVLFEPQYEQILIHTDNLFDVITTTNGRKNAVFREH